MEILEKLFDDDSTLDQPGNKSTSTTTASKSVEWCTSCQKQAKEMEERYAGNFVAVKQKILFTDNLIQMYQTTKKQLEEMTDKCDHASKEKSLVQAQLQLILSKDQPSYEETEQLRESVHTLENTIANLRTQLHAMDESRRIHEESIKVLKAEDSGAVFELKKKHLQQMSELRKELSEKNDENKKLVKKNKDLSDRLERLRSAKRKQQSIIAVEKPVDSTIFMNVQATDGARSEQDVEMTSPSSSDESASLALSASHGGDKYSANTKDKRAHIIKGNDYSDRVQERVEVHMEKNQGAHISFTAKPTKNQCNDLLSIMTDWKAKTCIRHPPKKQEAMDILCLEISKFCEKYSLETHDDIVAAKLCELYQHEISNKKTKSWLQEVVSKLAQAKEMDSSMASASFLKTPAPTSPVESSDSTNLTSTDEKASLEVSNAVESLQSQPEHAALINDFVSGMPYVSDSVLEEASDFVSKMPDVGDFVLKKTDNFVSKMPDVSDFVLEKFDDFVSKMPDVIDSASERSNHVSKCPGNSDHNISRMCETTKALQRQSVMIETVKNVKISSAIDFPRTRRRTRSMRDGSSSEHDSDISILSPPSRSRRIAHKQSQQVVESETSATLLLSRKPACSEKSCEADCKITVESNTLLGKDQLAPNFVSTNVKIVSDTEVVPHSLPPTLPELVSSKLSSSAKDGEIMELDGSSLPCTNRSGSLFDKSVASDAGYDLNEIFREMLLRGESLTPLPQSPKHIKPIDSGSSAAERTEPVLSECDDNVPQSEEIKSKDSILPSTVLCTAINFSTLSNDAIIPPENFTVNSLEKKFLPETPSKSRSRSASTDDIFSSESPFKSRQDLFRPRRFSCEAPEMALAVRPIKPLCTVPSFVHGQFPLAPVEKTTYPGCSKAGFPQNRKEKDIPSHWHATLPLKEFSSSSDEEGTSVVFADIFSRHKVDSMTIPVTDIPLCSEYDANNGLANTPISSSGIKMNLDITCKTTKKVDFRAQANSNDAGQQDCFTESLSSEKTGENCTETAADETIVKTVEKIVLSQDVDNSFSEYCTGDEGLVMDVSDDASEQIPQNPVDERTEMCETFHQKSSDLESSMPDLEQKALSSKGTDSSLCGTSLSFSTIKHVMVRATKLRKDSSRTLIVENLKDLKSACVKNAACKTKAAIRIEDSFVVNCIINVLKNSEVEVDLFKKCSESSSVMLADLPPSEQKFLKQMSVITRSEMVDSHFLSNTVIPLMMRVMSLGNQYHQRGTVDESDELLHRIQPFLDKKARCRIALPRLFALVRTFFFLCKMANVALPIFALCQYHIVYKRAVAFVASILQGILCWPAVLKKHLALGKAVICVLRRHVGTAQVTSDKKRARYLKSQIDWIDRQCCWTTSLSDHNKPLDPEIIDNAMARFESAVFSSDFLLFLEEESKNLSSTTPIPVFDEETTIGAYIVELISSETFMEQVKIELLDHRFWPLLNKWSRHLHIHGDTSQNSEVSKATIVVMLDAFAHILSNYLLRQRLQHPSQQTLPLMQSHYRVICDMLDNFSKPMYVNKAPRVVQCAVASFIIRTCFCTPPVAQTCLVKWVKATSSSSSLQTSLRHSNLSLITTIAGCDERWLKRSCHWLDSKNTSPPTKDSLVKLLWGD